MQNFENLTEKQVESREIFDGYIMHVFKDTVELPNGKLAPREYMRHVGAVCVVPLLDDGSVLLERQFRYPVGKVLMEIPAGKLEYGENHSECGLRELKEETGCTCDDYTYLGSLIPTPAYCGEVIHMYLARGLHSGSQKLDEGEFLDVVKIPLDEAIAMVMRNEIQDSKTQIALLKTKLLLEKNAH